MYIPQTMKNKIATTFYDKTIYLLTNETVTDEEGGVVSRGVNITGSFKGNVNFSNFKKIQEDYGFDYNIDIAITTDKKVNVNDFIKYNEIIYTVTDVVPSDSHYLAVATKWRQ